MFKTAYDIYAEISREYGIVALRFLWVDQGKITPDKAVAEVIEHQEKIKALRAKFNALMKGG